MCVAVLCLVMLPFVQPGCICNMNQIHTEKLQRLVSVLQSQKPPFFVTEEQMHAFVANCLEQNQIEYIHEYRFANRARIDFYCDGIGIEIKKGKPNRAQILAQLKKYAEENTICAIIVLVQSAMQLPQSLANKPIYVLPIYKAWSLSL